MKEIWIYGFVFLLGMVAGIILWERIGVDDVYRGVFRLKQKGRGNTQEQQTNLKIDAKRQARKERRKARKANRKG